jgi:hypothetical protein
MHDQRGPPRAWRQRNPEGEFIQLLHSLNVGVQPPPKAVGWNNGLDRALLIEQGVVAEDARFVVRKHMVAAVLCEDCNCTLCLTDERKREFEGNGGPVH